MDGISENINSVLTAQRARFTRSGILCLPDCHWQGLAILYCTSGETTSTPYPQPTLLLYSFYAADDFLLRLARLFFSAVYPNVTTST